MFSQLRSLLTALKILPSPFQWRNPFKIVEYLTLLSNVRVGPHDTVLDFGCGGGRQTAVLAKRSHTVVGLDPDASEVRRAQLYAESYGLGGRTRFVAASLEEAGFHDWQFDKIISFSVLEHVADTQGTLDLFYRLLKPRGELIFSTDWLATVKDAELRRQHASEGKVLRYFEPAELAERLKRSGFEEIRTRGLFRSFYAKRLFEKSIQKHFMGYHRVGALWSVFRLVAGDLLCRRHEGIFLCVRAVKAG